MLEDLLRNAGHKVMTAASAVEALVLIRMYKFDLILLDITMDGFDGHQLAHSLSVGWETFDIPIFVISARNDPTSKSWAKLHGCKRYIEKPFSPVDLLDAIDDHVRRNPAEVALSG